MEDKLCLDTDFLVNFLRNKHPEVEFIRLNEGNTIFATTMINAFELYYGAFKSRSSENLLHLEDLLQRLHIFNLSVESARRAGQIHAALESKGKGIDFRDLLIGCIAQERGFCIKTHDVRHFERIPGLRIHK